MGLVDGDPRNGAGRHLPAVHQGFVQAFALSGDDQLRQLLGKQQLLGNAVQVRKEHGFPRNQQAPLLMGVRFNDQGG